MSTTSIHPFRYSFTTCFKEEVIAEMLKGRTGQSLLEMGCGSAYFSTALRRRLPSDSFKYVGIDLEPDAIKVAKEYIKPTDTVKLDSVTGMSFAENTFDSIVYLDVIEHVDDDKKSLSEAYRVLKPGGTLVISTPDSDAPLTDTFFCEYMHDHDHMANHRAGYSATELSEMLKEANFKVEMVRHTNYFLSELLITLSKLGYRILKPKYKSQADVVEVSSSPLFSIYKLFVFPVGYLIGRVEAAILKHVMVGHCLIIRATK